MKIEPDIIIIGAGPAGCMAALLLSKKHNVIIIERKKLPREKSCSGVLIKKSVDIVSSYFGEIPPEVKCHPEETTGLNIINHNGENFEFPDNGINILRSKFDFWLLETAKRNGVEVLEESMLKTVQYINNRHYTVVKRKNENIEIVSKAVIACDGIHGTSRALWGAPQQKKIITVQRFYRGYTTLDPSKFYAYTSAKFSQYDAWVNSKNGNIIIGSIGFNRESAIACLDSFINYLIEKEKFQLSEPLKQEVWALPFVLPDLNILYQYNNVFFAGEVAGLLNPFGEGISLALTSGIAISESFIEGKISNIKEVESLYKIKMRNEIQYMKRQWDYLRRYSPEFFENILNCCNNTGIDNSTTL